MSDYYDVLLRVRRQALRRIRCVEGASYEELQRETGMRDVSRLW